MNTSPDSIFYMEQSSKLFQSFSITHFDNKAPPLYPFVQYLGRLAFEDVSDFLRLLHSALFGLNALLFSTLVARICGGSWLPGLVAIAVHCVNPSVYLMHSYALTEPLFITFLLAALLQFHSFSSFRDNRSLILLGLFIGLGIQTRFAGISYLGSLALCLVLLLRRETLATIVTRTTIFVATAIALPVLWSLLKYSFDQGSDAPRQMLLHPIEFERAARVLDVYAEWLLANQSPAFAGLLALLIVALAAVNRRNFAIPGFLLLNSLGYIAFIFITISVFDNYTPVDQRIFLPNWYLFFALTLWLLHAGGELVQRRRLYLGVSCAVVLLYLLGSISATEKFVSTNLQSGVGFYSKKIRQMAIHEVISNGAYQQVYTNSPELVLIYSNKKATVLPPLMNPVTSAANENFVQQIGQMLEQVDNGEAAIVIYDALLWRKHLPNSEFFESQFNMQPQYSSSDGTIYERIEN